MSLKAFHILFITISCVLAFAFGAWCMELQRVEGDGRYVVLGRVSFAVGAALIAYGVWFLRKLRRWEEDVARSKTSPLRGVGGAGPGAGPSHHLGM